MAFCEQCGRDLSAPNATCAHCAGTLAQKAPPRKSKPATWETIVSVLCVVPVIVIGTSGMHAGILLNAIWGGIAGAISAGIVALIKSARMSNDPLPGETTDGKMTAGLVLGSIGLVAWLLPIVGIPVSVAGTIISAPLLEKTRTKRARIALVLCLAGAIASLANSMYGIAINQR